MSQIQLSAFTPTIGMMSRGNVVARIGATLITWQQRASERAALASMDDRFLKDMGISRADALQEYSKPFWRA